MQDTREPPPDGRAAHPLHRSRGMAHILLTGRLVLTTHAPTGFLSVRDRSEVNLIDRLLLASGQQDLKTCQTRCTCRQNEKAKERTTRLYRVTSLGFIAGSNGFLSSHRNRLARNKDVLHIRGRHIRSSSFESVVPCCSVQSRSRVARKEFHTHPGGA